MVDRIIVADRPPRRHWYRHPIALAIGLCTMERQWREDPQYFYGYFVPGFALCLLWSRPEWLAMTPAQSSCWALTPIIIGIAAKLLGTRYYLGWIEGSVPAPLPGRPVHARGGWPALQWA